MFGLARDNAIHILTIDEDNLEEVLLTLPFGQNVLDDIRNAVNQGLVVQAPETEIAYEDWIGIGYLKENPTTGETGWILSGMIAGGMTAKASEKWQEDTGNVL